MNKNNEEIIIHGVNVNRCMFFCKEYEEDDIQMKNFCEWQYIPCREFDCAKCYFKNWKRKEQDCEKLKEQLEIAKQNYSFEAEKLEIYIQTLAEIKEIAENNKKSTLCFTAFEGDVIEVNNEPMTAILQKINEVEE